MSGPKDVLYKSEEQMSRADLVAFLRSLADRVESGRVVLTSGSKETPVDVPDRVELEVQYEEKKKPRGKRSQLELEIEWGEGGAGGVGLA
ncbi:MAG: amphi-Trp domain-containing protein [bacterium]